MILTALLLLLSAIVANPIIRLGIQELLPRAPIQLGAAEVSIPKTWMISQTPTRVTVWKPCATIFCDSAQASFALEVTDMPDDIWLRTAAQVLRDNFSTDVITSMTSGKSGVVKCVELSSAVVDGLVVASCINADLHLTSTFTGKPSLKSAFYAVLATAHRRS